MKQVPRDYQQMHLEAVSRALVWDNLKRVCIESATGTGKGSIVAWLVEDFLRADISPVLVVAHTETIVDQLYERIRDNLGLSEFEIGIEQAGQHASHSCLVVVASIQTLLSSARLAGWRPKAIIPDEAHHYASDEWLKALARFGAFDGECQMVGLSATLQRGDQIALFAYDVDGTPMLKDKDAEHLDKCLFQKCVSRYDIVQAVEENVLVPVLGYSSRSDVDLSGLRKGKTGDFGAKALSKKIDAPARTRKARELWEEHAKDRQTIVFCADVDHAYHAAAEWRQAGYTAEAADGSTDTATRRGILQRFNDGQTQVICNFGLWTEGFDCPACSCIVMLRPTKSEPLYKQMAGRGLRPLPGVIDKCVSITERGLAIAGSGKRNCIIIDIVDNNVEGILSAPSLINLPPDIDLQGHSLIETKRLLGEFHDHAGRIATERPKSYAELDLVLRRVDLLNSSGAASMSDWRATSNGYIFAHCPPGATAFLDRVGDTGRFALRVTNGGETLYHKEGASHLTLPELFDLATDVVKKKLPPPAPAPKPKTLFEKLQAEGRTDAGKIIKALRARGHSVEHINNMTTGYAKKLSGQYRAEYGKQMREREQVGL